MSELLPCAHCGSPAKYSECTDTENFGGQFIECTNLQCGMSTCITFPAMCSVKEELAEKWNQRHRPTGSDRAGLLEECREALEPFSELWHQSESFRQEEGSTCEWRIKKSDLTRAHNAVLKLNA